MTSIPAGAPTSATYASSPPWIGRIIRAARRALVVVLVAFGIWAVSVAAFAVLVWSGVPALVACGVAAAMVMAAAWKCGFLRG